MHNSDVLEPLIKAALKTTDLNILKELTAYLNTTLSASDETPFAIECTVMAEEEGLPPTYEIRTEYYALRAQHKNGFKEHITTDGIVTILCEEYETYIEHFYPKEIVMLLDTYFRYNLRVGANLRPIIQWADENLRDDH